MSMGRIFAPRAVDNASSNGNHGDTLFAASDETFREGNTQAQTRFDPRSVVQRRFMNMLEVHDRMRARVLGSSPAGSYVSGD